jgi:molybdopterin-guanine dinucleotide biosynthesis protein A
MTLTGAVLVGGRSSRMGRDKAALSLGDETLLERQLRLLDQIGVSQKLVLGRREHPHRAPDSVFVADAAGFAGPIAGLLAAIDKMDTSHLLVLAVDLPRLTARAPQALRELCTESAGSVPCRDHAFEPLVAIYHRSAACTLRAQATAGRFGIQEWMCGAVARGEMRIWDIPEVLAPEFLNCNSPADWARATADRAIPSAAVEH